MAKGDVFYVIEFRNPTVDDHVHYMTFGFTPSAKQTLEDHLKIFLTGRQQLTIDIEKAKQGKMFASKMEADAEGVRRGKIASDANPDRVDATAQFPAAPNLMLEVGNNAHQPPLNSVTPQKP